MKYRNLTSLLFLVIVIMMWGCSSSEPLVDEDGQPLIDVDDEMAADYLSGEYSEDEWLLITTRSKLSDAYAVAEHEVPDLFFEEVVEDEIEEDIFAGYRVQIISTRDVNLADSLKSDFEVWADTTFANTSPRAYIHFRQPFYRVHVGDFNNRQRAIEFSRMIKWKFNDAWTVYDRINPYRVLPDSVDIELVDYSEIQE
jgi:hypothetical protein